MYLSTCITSDLPLYSQYTIIIYYKYYNTRNVLYNYCVIILEGAYRRVLVRKNYIVS